MPKTKEHALPILAIDIGGTKIITAIISDEGQVMAKEYCPTLADEGPQAVLDRIFSTLDHLLGSSNMAPSQLNGLSIAAAGAIDFGKGIVTLSPNLPGWRDIPLRDIVKERYGINTFLLNDASAAVLGEHRFGAGRGLNNIIYITVSTGIGSGILINGELYLGASGGAGEVGHTTIDVNGPKCSCGNTGCLETLASGTAVAREAIRRIKAGEKSSLTEIAGGKVEDITAEEVSIAAQGGDSLASEIISQAATYLSIGLLNLVNIFNPEMIIVGGGMSNMGDLLLNPARQVVKERAFQLLAKAVRIVVAELGNNAEILGAAVFAYQQKPIH